MLRQEQMHNYQRHCVQHIIEHEQSGLFLEMGLGKTISTLTAIDQLMYDRFEVEKVLVIAPKRVAEDTWKDEVNKWEHLKHLKLSIVLGSESKRKAALMAKADIYVINRENVAWLVGMYGTAFPFDMVVIDELSSFKSPSAQRFKALKSIRPRVKRVVGLTGTPAPNGLIDLWSQLYLLDMGERLGKTVTGYRTKYFSPGRTNGQVVFDYRLKPECEAEIQAKIADICISMKSEDYLELPKRIDNIVSVRMTDTDLASYKSFEESQILQLLEVELSVVNAAALSNKLLQFANGAVYDENKDYHCVHNAKLEALEEIIDTANSPVLVFYRYKHDLERIQHHLRRYNPRTLKVSQDIQDWNSGKVEILLAHPASAGHGLNLQAGGNNVVWFGETWSLELYQQANARLHRQGQTKPVIIHHLITVGTLDEDVVKSLDKKEEGQEALMQAIKARINKYSGQCEKY